VRNIILIVTDTFRYDNLGERAPRPVRTPALDEFASRRATEVTRFYTGSFPTIPHRTDVASGTIGWPHYGWQPIDLSGPNHVALLLRDAGYATQLVCDCPHLFNARFQHGFDAAYQHRGQEGDKPVLHLNDPISTAVPPNKTRVRPVFRGQTLVDVHRWTNREPRYETESFPAKTGTTAIRWLEENSAANPFFLWVDFFDPHEPWDAPEYLVRRYDPDYAGPPMWHPNYGPSSAYTPEELHNLWAHYAAEAELVDRWIGRVLQKLDDLQLWDDTVVVITSDHGMSLGEHGRTGKSNIHDDDHRYWPLYPELGHVPFLIAGGDVPAGRRLGLIAQPADILPTLADLAAVSLRPSKPFDGLSFAEAVRRGSGGHREVAVSGSHIHVVAAEADTPAREGLDFPVRGGAPPREASTPFLVTDRWGYAPVGAAGRPELYDLSADPLAEHDLARDMPQTVGELHRAFVDHLEQLGSPAAVLALWQEEGGGPAAGRWAIDYAGTGANY
jgi:arylsulfatase A-like enzyme